MRTKIIAAIATVGLIAAACGGGGDGEETITNVQTGEEASLQDFVDQASDAQIAKICREFEKSEEAVGSAAIAKEIAIEEIAAEYDVDEADAEAIRGEFRARC